MRKLAVLSLLVASTAFAGEPNTKRTIASADDLALKLSLTCSNLENQAAGYNGELRGLKGFKSLKSADQGTIMSAQIRMQNAVRAVCKELIDEELKEIVAGQ